MLTSALGWLELESGSDRTPVPLLTALLGVASTIVAIVGGLLVARLSALAAQRVTADQAVDRADAAEVASRTQVQAAEQRLRACAAQIWLANSLPTLVGSGGATGVGLQYLLTRQAFEYDKTLLDQPLSRTTAKLREAFAEIKAAAPNDVAQWPERWATARGLWRMQLDPAHDHLYEAVFAKMLDDRASAIYHQRVRAQEAAIDAARAKGSLGGLAPPRAVPAPQAVERPGLDQHLEQLKQERSAAEEAARHATDRHREAQTACEVAALARTAAQTPPNTRGAWRVLLYMSVVGICLPLALLAFEPTQIGLGWRIALPVMFSLGLAALVAVLYSGLRSRPMAAAPAAEDAAPAGAAGAPVLPSPSAEPPRA